MENRKEAAVVPIPQIDCDDMPKAIPGAGACKVRRMTANIGDGKVEREHTACFLK